MDAREILRFIDALTMLSRGQKLADGICKEESGLESGTPPLV